MLDGVDLKNYSTIDKEMIDHICKIAKLNLTEKESDQYMKELQEILETFKVMDKVDTPEDPSYHPIPIRDRMRDDEVKEQEWDPLGNAKYKDGKYFKGPKIV